MMKRRLPSTLAVCGLALAASSSAWAQKSSTDAGASTRPRSENERIVTEGGTPSTINRQAQKDEAAAEAARGNAIAPNIPPGAVGSSSVPAPAPLPGAGLPGGTGIPTGPGAGTLTPPAGRGMMSARPAMAPGLDVAMLVEHAVAMAIEGSALQAIALPSASDPAGKELLDHGRQGLQEGRDLLARAASDGRSVPASSPIRRFYDAANAYVTTLSAMSAATPPTPAEMARVAMVNHSVKEVLDANHVMAMGSMAGGTPATDQLLQHARTMKDTGTQTIMRLAGNAAPGAPPQPGAATLAQQGRNLLEAADQLAASMPPAMSGRGMLPSDAPGQINGGPDVSTNRRVPAPPGGLPNNGENPNAPGRFQDPRPEIIGGTYSTGSPSVGTVNNAGVKEALREAATTPNPDPNPALPNTPNTLGPNGNVVPADKVPGSANPTSGKPSGRP